MLVFEKFTKEKLKEYSHHLKTSGFLCNDFSIGSILAWGDFNKTEVAKINDTLIVKQQVHGAPIFSFPFGNDVYGAIDGLIEYVSKNNLPLAFCGIDDNLLDSIINFNKFSNCIYGFDRRWSDYIYDFEEMRTFQGKKFSGQRNHINKFIKLYGKPDFSEIETEDLPNIKLMLEKYRQENAERFRTEDNEIIATEKLLENFRDFDDFFGAKLKVNGEVISFAIGEIVGDSLIIHAEKALKTFQGVYPTTFNCFVNFVYNKTPKAPLYVNREDDSGDLGLRTSKTQYKPIFLVNKNVIRVNCPLAKISEHPVLIGEGVYLDQITEEDKENYYNLCVDEEINKLWPYNYKKDDSITESLSHDTFYKKQLHHNKIGTSINFAIREEKGGELLGETIVHNFTYNLGGEMGCRLLLSARGKKLGAKAYKLTADWAEQVLKVKITGKCLKENVPSYKMITSSGFSMIKDDGKYFYFQRKNAE